MLPSLSSQVQLKLEQTLAQWHQWHCEPRLKRAPIVVATLSAGIGNHSVLVESDRQFVVRIDGLNPMANGLSRQTEWRTLGDAHRAGLAPGPRYFNPDLGCLVCDYLPHDNRQRVRIADVAQLLRAIHQLPARHHRLDLGERVRRYERMLEHRDSNATRAVQTCRKGIAALMLTMQQPPLANALCHNDLLQANRLYSGGRLWALDWEYCAMGNPLYDLAVIIQGDKLSAVDANHLVKTYLGHAADPATWDSLYAFGCLYRYLDLLWYLALAKPLAGGESLAEKLATLEALLSRSHC
ncbi:MAG: phosphotransferase [Halioglobus sp.]|nr:phosphotransferase [Halioglobus sp.]